MKTFTIYIHNSIGRLLPVLLLCVVCCCCQAQVNPTDSIPDDPAAMRVFTYQNLSFGAFMGGPTGGKVIISNSGSRSVTGTVTPLSMGVMYFQAIFEVSTPHGSIVSLLNGPDAVLTGSNGGTMSMHIGSSDPPSPFVTTAYPPLHTQVSVGGTLTLGNPASNPPGTYSGNFYIIFNRE